MTSKNIAKIYEATAHENPPKRLKQNFLDFDIRTVADNNWTGKKNGEL